MADAETDDDAMARRIVESANELARSFYRMAGYVVAEEYRFDKATHPQERLCWQMACKAYEFIDGTSPEDALSEIDN
ncbi:MAG: hypothetical protein AB7O57_04205 [Hyphomicrobiaceae bacterium]